uniref:Phosphatidic acid phosphatase type 2/haloperoxidase domain-containing protein n=1 Tax=Wuchereria bancrofti TaxID=6293 RepID=A0AAF5PYS8_WUCBA
MVELSISRITADFAVLALCAIPLLIFHKWVEPYKRGFYCDDESIRYPYRPSTVSRQMLVVIGLVVPAILIVSTETFRVSIWERKCKNEFQHYRCKRYGIPRLIVRLYVFFGYFLTGVIFNQLMVDIAKYTIGRHRPHFIAVCKPKGFETCPSDSHEYITNFECTGTDKYLIHESMLSFYSGHSAFSFYAAWYTALYLQARLYRPLFSRLLLPVIQFALFGGAAFVAYTRVSDYKHHWSDVLVGSLFGSTVGIVVALFIAEVFSRREIPPCDVRYCKREFGLASELERVVPLSDVETGMSNIVRTDGSGSGAQFISSHNITVTGMIAPNVNEVRNNQMAQLTRQTPRNQRFPSSTSLQSISMTGSYYSAHTNLDSLITATNSASCDNYSALSYPIMSSEMI